MNAASWWLELWAAPAALGFAVLFNVPPRTLLPACLLAIAGHTARRAMMVAGSDIVLATLVAALLIGVAAGWWGRRTRQVSEVYSVCAAIPLVPGVSMYKAAQALLGIASVETSVGGEAFLLDAGVYAVKAVMIMLALAIGIAAPMLLWPRR
ncbi:threonine/serine exporter family protein [Chitiniphilus eburneus]|uniref:Threonine/serine exporter n=1 Tax=Chitiniphilus eburneus TaxID=2571148 RepID=A0A4U0Q884_9NEIS|nr:threonine/serine exporter family protein [Chitiniphilus eburneus]TJZ77459.1 threonine/serine exporter [Chitiniphilus eburneus]